MTDSVLVCLGWGWQQLEVLEEGAAIRLQAMGFETTFDNSIDAVASRDLLAEYVFVSGQAMVTLSRLSEDLLLWATQ